jgi:Asp-tRNA(Asn)/Glu-tRNA(Gln) amidotransferase A subunit family amidase
MNKKKKIISTETGFILALLGAAALVVGGALFLYLTKGKTITTHDIAAAEKLNGLHLTRQERKMMLRNLKENLASYQTMRQVSLPNSVPPALHFSPLLPGMTIHADRAEAATAPFSDSPAVKRPADLEELAFYPVTDLARLIRSRKVTSTELTRMYLGRLKKYGPRLECVVTLNEELALAQAGRADEEIAAGRYRGPLHGIPWGAKDLLATKGIRTTWGAKPYENQIFDANATVVERLEQAGAVLVAKLSMGALAWGDVWFGGKTRNPWNTEQGSSGSSAGSAAATAAGLVGFAIGTETWGSIVSPSTRCGVTGLRPTFGRVSRSGAMALSWSMDKIGPICRSAEDCALVFESIYGPDGQDLTVVDLPFSWDPALDIKSLRIGYLKKAFERDYRTQKIDLAALDVLRSQGVELIPFDLPEDLPVEAIAFILNAEAAAAFEELTLSNRDDLLVRQERNAWPNVFRQARFIPAVEYIQANRIRTRLMQEMAARLKDIDVYVAPSFGGNNLLLTNLTGHPAVVAPDGLDEKGLPTSISFIGRLYEESKVLRVAHAFQQATAHHLKHPELSP